MKKTVGGTLLLLLLFCAGVSAEDYLTVEGVLNKITGTFLLITDPKELQLSYPISPYVQVFDKIGQPSTLAAIANIGYVSKARIYVLKGKVEKIVIVDQFQ